MVDDADMENTFGNLAVKNMVSRTDKMLESVGLNESTARKLFTEEESTVRRRAAKDTKDAMVKWTALSKEEDDTSAVARARQSRARLHDLEDEMEALAERQAARERRVAGLRALMAENAEESDALQMRTARVVARTEKKVVSF